MDDSDKHLGAGPEQPGTQKIVIDAASGSSVYAVLHGDMHIRNGYPVYQIMPFPLSARHVPGDKARQQPSRLLAADSRVVPFSGRTAELSELAAWRDDPEPGVSVMLVHAPGGQGKTRLAARFAADSAADGWKAWAARHLSDPTGQHVVSPGDSGRALVLVVDYADRWPVDDLLLLLNNPLLRRPERARVLLVARHAGAWWPSLRHRLGKADISLGPTMALQPLAETTPERGEAFTSALEAFAVVFGTSASSVPVPAIFASDAFHLILTVHMAALVAVDAHWRGTSGPADPAGLSAYLLDREHDFWHSMHDHEQVSITPQAMGRTVYTATLTHALQRHQAITVLERAGVADTTSALVVLDDHSSCYPPTGSDREAFLEPLYPDRLGEDYLALTTPGHTHPDYTPDQWAQNAPARLLTPVDGYPPAAAPVYARPAMTALIETARRWPHVARQQLYPLLHAHPQLALAAGGTALGALAESPDISVDLLEAIEAHLPGGRDTDLDTGIATIAQRLADHRLATTTDPTTQARIHNDLGVRLSYAGLYQQAATTAHKAVQAYQQLADAEPATFEPLLATSLNNLGAWLSAAGRRQDALTATQEATIIRRRLAQDNPAAYQPDLAKSLTNLGNNLSDLGRKKEALAAAEEAAAVARWLAQDNPAAYSPDLARSLDNLGVVLSGLGRQQDALTAAEEGVRIRRQLAQDHPAAFQPSLALGLSNLGIWLLHLGRREEALAATQDAVTIRQRLAQANPAAHEPDLAKSLSNLGMCLSGLGRHGEALAAAEGAVEIQRRLAQANPSAYEPNLVTMLDNLGARLLELGRPQDALAVAVEAIEVCRRLARANPSAYEPNLASLLNNLSVMLSKLSRTQDALTASEEAVAVYRQMNRANPSAHDPDLAKSLSNLGARLSALGRHKEALAATEESAVVARRLAEANPAAHGPDLARSLNNLSVMLSKLSRTQDALTASEEALAVYRRLAQANPGAFEPGLAASLSTHTAMLAGSGRLQDALAAAEEAATVYQRLAHANPAAHEQDLAKSLNNLAAIQAVVNGGLANLTRRWLTTRRKA